MRIAVSLDEDNGRLSGARACRESIEHAHHNQEETPRSLYDKDEVGRLEEEAESLARQMAKIQRRIDKMKSKK
jgi:hypothetical protein